MKIVSLLCGACSRKTLGILLCLQFCAFWSLYAADSNSAYLSGLYEAAVQHAMRDRVDSEVSRNLIAVVPTNRLLHWRSVGNKQQVLCVTWTRDKYTLGRVIRLPRDAVIWVTVVPELRLFCRAQNWHGVPRILRIEELLGLPPNFNLKYFVEFWASPEDLIRPSPDPEITDHEAEITFRAPTRFGRVSQSYLKWFKHTAELSYHHVPTYPWTRLGYTYDWGQNPSHVGLSEFVVIGGATIQIESVSTTAEYLGGH